MPGSLSPFYFCLLLFTSFADGSRGASLDACEADIRIPVKIDNSRELEFIACSSEEWPRMYERVVELARVHKVTAGSDATYTLMKTLCIALKSRRQLPPFALGLKDKVCDWLESEAARQFRDSRVQPAMLLETHEFSEAPFHELRESRVLVAVAAYNFGPKSIRSVQSLLRSLAELCHDDVDVHVALQVTSEAWQHVLAAQPVLYPCSGEKMTIFLSIFSAELRWHLTGTHRTLFKDTLELYDWFVYLEEDCSLSRRNFAAIVRQFFVLRSHESGFLPGLIRRQPGEQLVLSDVSCKGAVEDGVHRLLIDQVYEASAIDGNTTIYIALNQNYQASWILPQSMLATFMNGTEWLRFMRHFPGDLWPSGGGIAEYFASHWIHVDSLRSLVPWETIGDHFLLHTDDDPRRNHGAESRGCDILGRLQAELSEALSQ
jgi:hypothetical protein